MKNSLLLPLLVVVLALVAGAWWFTRSAGPGAGPHGVTELERGDAPAQEPHGPSDDLSAAPAAVATPERAAVAEAAPVTRESSTREAASLPADVIWVEGRVAFPDDLPIDEAGAEVTARGRRFGGKDDPRREYVAPVAYDGGFRVAFSAATRKGWLELSGRYLYMKDKLTLDMSDLPAQVVLEPELGGLVHGKLTPPPGLAWDAARAAEAVVRINAWGGVRVSRSAAVDENGEFELTGLPPSSNYYLQVEHERWSGERLSEIKVLAGEVTEVTVELTAGATVAGRVVDAAGAPLMGVELTLLNDAANVWPLPKETTDAEGAFAFHGVAWGGDVRLTAERADWLPATLELGKLSQGQQRVGLELVLRRGETLTGLVRWPDGTPAADAWVQVEQEREGELPFRFGPDGENVRTAADGTFAVGGLELKPCTVRASARSVSESDKRRAAEAAAEGEEVRVRRRGSTYVVKVDGVVPGATDLVLVLEAGDVLNGRAVDDRGEGLTRFVISAEPLESVQDELEPNDAFHRPVLSLDGSFAVDGLRDGAWRVRALSDDHEASEWVEVRSPGAGEVELVLPRMASVAGVVRAPGGAEISGASVFVEDAANEEHVVRVRQGQWGEKATSGRDGRFEASELAPGRKAVFAAADGYAQGPEVYVELQPGQALEGLALTLRRGARLTGEVNAAAGPIAKRSVMLQGQDGLSYYETVETDARGRFELDGLNPGRYRLELRAPSGEQAGEVGGLGMVWFDGGRGEGAAVQNAVQYADLSEGGHVHVVLGSPPSDPLTVAGRITRGGAPVADCAVQCRATDGDESNRASAVSDAEGRYELTVSGAGRYEFVVGSRPDQVREVRDLAASGATVDLELPGGRIGGLVRGDDGELVEGAWVLLVRYQDPDGKGVGHPQRSGSTDAEGAFAFENLEPGRYRLEVSKSARWSWTRRGSEPGLGAVLLEDLVLAEGGALEDVAVRLEPAATIRGTVLGPDGQGLGGARIRVTSPSGQPLSRASGSSDASGAFELDGIGGGTWRVFAEDDGRHGAEVEVRVAPGGESEIQLLVD
ncbi:MAG: carboxypeptidase regulatory-like domain-containing protein [Planctomycetes bacterium]|nr:carboxypeptidase regulatory-like domain-containing protein [Planctomycetota bacterium]